MKELIAVIRKYFPFFLLSIILCLVIANLFLSNQYLISIENSGQSIIIEDTLITILSPNGGEIWEPGTTEFIKWNSFGITNLKVEYSDE
ncbi:MAG: hypothetical protein MZV64_01885 [Ignavibacteriales bacterium]|nr:hypothetical protein [Ignavibacteriales bacterium]